jgi:soluble lytic murein transglycosylase-like protein
MSPRCQNSDVGGTLFRVDVILGLTSSGETETIRGSESNNARNSADLNLRSAVQQRFARTHRRALIWLVVLAVAGLGTDDALPGQHHRHAATHRKHVRMHRSKVAKAPHHHKYGSKPDGRRHARLRQSKRHRLALATVPGVSLPGERPLASLPPDLAAVKQAIELVRQRKPREATTLVISIGDPVARKLAEWALLRDSESEAGFERYATFIRANPDWPSIPLLRRRAEVRLWQERRDGASLRRSLGRESTGSVGRASVKREVGAAQDTDGRWRERRALARRLIDLGDGEAAYRVVREAVPPANPNYRAEFHFMAGWIALRFLGDPSTALEHFGHVDEGSADPIVRARAAYWRGRAAEAAGQFEEMRIQYEAAARYPTAYSGQLAKARLGLGEIAFRQPPPEPAASTARELVHAADILYAIGERDLVVSFMTDLAKESSDVAALAALGELTRRYDDAQAMLLIGKTALARGLAMEEYAFPDIGVPLYNAVGPELDRCIVYSIVRTESAFNQRDMSPAKAVGLMQVTPEAGRDTAKRFGFAYNWNRLVSDPVYNTQMGAAEVAALLNEYRGSYIMTFAGYNAGRGRVAEWVAKHGDPRDPKVDAVDWVERIPFAETRNYVQRVMENLQVYCARFGTSTATVEPNLHRAATVGSRTEPVLVEAFPE